MIVANGCPKSGTHALMKHLARQGKVRVPGLLDGLHFDPPILRATSADTKPLQLEEAAELSDDHFVHGHVPAGASIDPMRVLTVIRDPRAVLLSYSRAYGVKPEDALFTFSKLPFVSVYSSFLGWPEKVRYEDLVAEGPIEGPDLYADAARDNDTWSGELHDWREDWTPELERLWEREGGPDLVAAAGYA